MTKERRKKHLRLIKSNKTDENSDGISQGHLSEQLEEMYNSPKETEFLLLTGPPDTTVAIDKNAPLEVRLRVVAAVKSYTMGNKSVDYLLRKYRALWEELLPGTE